jgi:cystinosin
MSPALAFLSTAFGWIYTFAWSLSFYPQPLLNYRRKSTSGTTIDFPTINVLGFAAYFASNAAFLYSTTIRDEYAQRNKGLTPSVRFNDLAFAAHAVILSAITYSQFYAKLWGFNQGVRSKVSRGVAGIWWGSLFGVAVVALIVVANGNGDASTGWAWIDVVSLVILNLIFMWLLLMLNV